jgi:acyl-coenzyme A thioesterase PaaI-like protein
VRLALAIEQVGGGRLLVTTPDGLALNPGGGFASLLDPGRSETAIEADAERTRSLRALHGGRILAVVKHE